MAKNTLQQCLDTLKDAEGDNRTSVGDILNTFQHRGFGPLLLVPSLLMILPTGAIPGASIVGGIVVIALCAQMLMGKQSPWLPETLKNKSFDSNKLRRGIQKVEPFTQWLDRHTGKRLVWFTTSDTAKRVVAGVGITLALLLFPLALVPFAVFIPAAALLILSIGLTVRDGLIIVIGLSLSAVACISGTYWLMA